MFFFLQVRHEDATVIKSLFEDHFYQVYKWTYTSLSFVTEVLQINVIQQMQVIFEGLLPSMKVSAEEEEEKHKKPYQRSGHLSKVN